MKIGIGAVLVGLGGGTTGPSEGSASRVVVSVGAHFVAAHRSVGSCHLFHRTVTSYSYTYVKRIHEILEVSSSRRTEPAF